MKIRPLPDIDLARIAPQPPEEKRKSLEQLKGGRPPFSYKPLRSCFDDIFNMQPDLAFGSTPPTDWSIILEALEKRCRSEVELVHNTKVALGLHEFAQEFNIHGRKHDFYSLAMGMGKKVTFWLPMVVGIHGRPHAIFIEPRRTRGLSAEGRRFAFSMMHERIRASDEDFSEVGLGIIRFGAPSEERRVAKLYTDEGVELYSLDELESMVSTTYEMWRDVLEERDRDTKRKATGTGPLI